MLTLNHQKLIRFLDIGIRKQKYGTLTLTVIVKDGVPIVDSARVTKMRRKKYKTARIGE